MEEIIKLLTEISNSLKILGQSTIKCTGDEKTVLISPTEAFKLLGVGRNALYCDLLKRDDFPAFMIGGKYYINKLKLQEWADKQSF